ncbi:MAG TPA: CHAT domain-containing protein [Pyrinomonadaceae bacterium]|nr:CHAT domain-containing protein [Pyrinomonadaceae bacterium]
MNESVQEQAGIRDYLLGILDDDAQMRQIEEKLLLDDKFADIVSIAEDKLIEDFLDGSLKHDQRKKFVEFFLSTPRRRQQFRLTKNFRRYSANAATPEKDDLWSRILSVFSSPVPVAVGAACLILAAFLGWIVFFHRSDTQMVTQLLDRAYKNERPFESRVSNLAYAPYNVTRGEKAPPADQRDLDAAESISATSAARGDTAASLQNAGRVYLVKGNIDQAIIQFEKARDLAPGNAEIFNDLGAAFLEKSRSVAKSDSGQSLELKSKALENLSRAVELDSGLLAARFNKALCLQRMGLNAEAKKEWEEYIKLDPASPWTEEAKRNLNLLSTERQSRSGSEVLQDFLAARERKDDNAAYQIVSRNREMISGKLIPQQLAFLFLTGPEAERQTYLSALKYLGQIEKERSSDTYVSGIAQYYEGSTPEKAETLRQAYRSLNEGYNRCLNEDCKEALDAFDDAATKFDQAGDTWEARLCDYWRGYVLFRLGRIGESTQVLTQLAETAQTKDHKWLAAQAFSWLAINSISSKDFSKALDHNRTALVFAEAVSDLYLTEKVSSQTAEVYQRLGDFSRATVYLYKALESASQPDASNRQRSRDYDAAANMFFAMKNYHTALAYKKESIEAATITKEDTFFFTAYTGIASIYGSQGNYKQAFDAFDKSLEIAAGFRSESLKQKSLAYCKLQLAHIQRQEGNCSTALKNYGEAASFFDSDEYQAFSYDAHKGKLLCYYQNKDEDAFRAELPVIFSLFNDYREKITEEQNRNTFFNKEQSVYDIAISHEFDQADYVSAFDHSEESRARTLLDLHHASITSSEKGLAAGTASPLKLEEIRARMPAGAQLVQYSVLADKTLIWLITKDNFEVVKTDVSSAELYDLTAAYLELVARANVTDVEKRKEIAIKLYQELIAPIENKLDPGKEICIIPDKILFRLPFSTLISPANGSYFIANYTFFVSPSANIFLICSDKARELGQKTDEHLLSIGNPVFDKEDHSELSSLDDLSDAEQEARDVAALYGDSIVLTGSSATKYAVEKDLGGADVVHFAGHYLVNDTQPLLSGLVLAEDKKSSDLKDSLLANHEIIRGKFLNAKLIVLSACQSGVEKFYNGEGMIGSSRAFLATGVPLVVASQWNVDSGATAELMTRFHRYRKQNGSSTVDALRRAQLDMLDSQNSIYREPYYWAAFETIGGYAEF